MDISAAIQLKADLEASLHTAIAVRLQEFQEATGLCLSSIDILTTTIQRMSSAPVLMVVGVKLDVHL